MLLEDIKKILSQLANHMEYIQVPIDGLDITIRILDNASKLCLTTAVYYGGNYIPSSVRRSLSHKFPARFSSIKTFLTVDEQHFQIHLNYLGNAQPLSYFEFKEILEEFGSMADMWRQYLDEHDKNDLVHVRVK